LSKLASSYPPDISSIVSGKSELCKRDICAVIKAVRKLGSEWRILISYYLLDNPLRFNDLLRKGKPDDLNARTLSRTLKYLQSMGIVERTVVGTEPFSVIYVSQRKDKTSAISCPRTGDGVRSGPQASSTHYHIRK
jgi:DNA-binding HxlR family transcriptional regulator